MPKPSASPAPRAAGADPVERGRWPDNPVLALLWRGAHVESQHRGAWVLVDRSGTVRAGAGDSSQPVFARSSVKSLQALPLIESGAAARFAFSDAEIALALASHGGEPRHVEGVAALLKRLGLSEADLQCGPQPPLDPAARSALEGAGLAPSPLHNNCSGKHAGFLALALHLGADPARYLDPDGPPQRRVREAVLAMALARPGEVTLAVDGCSAPTFRLPLERLATALARVADPADLPPERREACERMGTAVARHPELIAGTKRLCTDLARATGGRIFPKVGGEAVYALGVRGAGLGLAIKVDDGSSRALAPLVVELLARLALLSPSELEALSAWRPGPLYNWAGLEVGRLEVVP
jgi:L-asparaginase II